MNSGEVRRLSYAKMSTVLDSLGERNQERGSHILFPGLSLAVKLNVISAFILCDAHFCCQSKKKLAIGCDVLWETIVLQVKPSGV